MDTFLDSVAGHILDHHSDSMGGLVVVLPSRRACSFLNRSLWDVSRSRGITFWMPEVYSIEDFFFTASGFTEADNTGLMLELFRIHKDVSVGGSEGLDQFLSWAPLMVSDFSAIDEALADARQVFSFISEAKAIEQWTPGGGSLSEGQKQYVAFFRDLYTYYKELRKALLNQRKAYKGMAARAVYESQVLKNHPKWEHFLFAGFYANSQCEENLFMQLKKQGQLTRLVDADAYYVDNIHHEAGHFIRKTFKDKKIPWTGNYYLDQQKTIEIMGTPGNTGQAQLAGALIHEKINGNKHQQPVNPEDIAVVLPDEGLLMPLLNSLPEELDAVNATMGYPITNTSMALLIKMLMHVANERERFGRNTLHKKELSELSGLPVVQYVAGKQNEKPKMPAQEQKLFFTNEQVNQYLPKTVAQAIGAMDNPGNLLKQLTIMCQQVHDQLAEENYMLIERHAAAMMGDRLTGLKEIFEENQPLASFKELNKLVQKTILNGRLPFTGEPLQGVQIMGMLESRALDFKHVIILSANEGVIPEGKKSQSLIPFDIRKKFHMATYGDSDSIFAYHFYRLIQRAQHVDIVYDTEAGTLGSNEKSRFIRQMLYELPSYNKELTISERIIPPQPANQEPPQINIPVTDGLREQVRQHLENKGLSATAIRALTTCSLQFYFRYLLKLSPPDEPEETIPMHVFGLMMHKILEDTYKQFLHSPKKTIDAKALEQAKEQRKQLITRYLNEYNQEYDPESLKQGRNKLMTDLAETLLERFFNSEIQQTKEYSMEVVSLEERMTCLKVINGCRVTFKGLADRIDNVNGTMRIMDYKTGNLTGSHLSQSNPFESLEELKNGEIIQVLFYDWLYKEVHKNDETRKGGIFLLGKPQANSIFFNHNKQAEITPEIRQQFEKVLTDKVKELLDPEMAFTQTEETDDCEYCDFVNVCNR